MAAPIPGVMAFFVQHMPYMNAYFPAHIPPKGPAPSVQYPLPEGGRQFKAGVPNSVGFYGMIAQQASPPIMK